MSSFISFQVRIHKDYLSRKYLHKSPQGQLLKKEFASIICHNVKRLYIYIFDYMFMESHKWKPYMGIIANSPNMKPLVFGSSVIDPR